MLLNKLRTYCSGNYNNIYFWLSRRKDSNIYDFGFKQNLINEKGQLTRYNLINMNSNILIKKDEEIGIYEQENRKVPIYNPLDNCCIININDIDINKLNRDPENIENSIATFEIKHDILRETYFKYFR
jgi:hypothetical protein